MGIESVSVKVLVELEAIEKATDLRQQNDILTGAMARQDIQALIKEDQLDRIVDAVVNLAIQRGSNDRLFAAAILGRLAAVARARESQVYGRICDLGLSDPPSIESLADSDEKLYAVRSMMHLTDDGLLEYFVREALTLDTAELVRKELLGGVLERVGTLSDLLAAISNNPAPIVTKESLDSRLKHVRRIARAVTEVAEQWRGELGPKPGQYLSDLLSTLLKGKLHGMDSAVLFDSVDYCLAVLSRIIELRFSHALSPETYVAIEQGKRILGPGVWARFLARSRSIATLRTALLEGALVLARQNRTDKRLLNVMLACYASRPQVSAAVKRHFKQAEDLVPDVAEFWVAVGQVTGSRQVEQKVGNSEDEQIGALLIEVESSQEVMAKLGRAVAPMIEISDPVMARTVKRAAQGYIEISQIVRRLARMRKLSATELRGRHIEYNPLEQQLLDGHRPGVRRVRVVRDGIRKTFGKKTRTLVKPWVESEE